MDEELLFNEWAVYLKCRFLIDKFWEEDNVEYLYEIFISNIYSFL